MVRRATLVVLLALVAGCGRIAFDVTDRDADASGDTPTGGSPDLTVLLPTRVSALVGYWRMNGNANDSGPHGIDLSPHDGNTTFDATGIAGSMAARFYDTSLIAMNRPELEVPYLSFSV